jgi:hypothetical protein
MLADDAVTEYIRYGSRDPIYSQVHFLIMKISRCTLFSFLILAASSVFAGEEYTLQASASPPPKDENSHDLFYAESTYTFSSDFKESRLGDGDSWYKDFQYDHRFLITGKWYLRAGGEYERYDFGGTDNGLPNHLQAAYAHLALEYLVHDHPGASIELDPGFYFENHVNEDAFDIPWKAFVSFPLKKDKIFGVVGLGGGLYQDPIVAPGGGLIWLISDKVRLQAVFPKPALVWDLTDDLEFRLMGEISYDSFRTDDVITPLRKLQVHNAIVQYHEDRVGAQLSYSGLKPFKIVAAGGYTVQREFDFFRHDVAEKVDPAPFVKLAIEARF